MKARLLLLLISPPLFAQRNNVSSLSSQYKEIFPQVGPVLRRPSLHRLTVAPRLLYPFSLINLDHIARTIYHGCCSAKPSRIASRRPPHWRSSLSFHSPYRFTFRCFQRPSPRQCLSGQLSSILPRGARNRSAVPG